MAKEIAVHSPLEAIDRLITVNAMNLPENLDFDRWAKMGEGLGLSRKMAKNGSIMFHVGDWLNYSERHQFANSGESYAQALEATGYAQNTLYQCKYVAGAVPPERRRMDELSFSHHVHVAPLDPENQNSFLEIAVADKLTAAKLKNLIGGSQAESANGDGAETGETQAERISRALDEVQRDMPDAQHKAEEFFTMATAFLDTLKDAGSVDNETIANVQAASKTLAEICNRVFKELGELL